MSFFNQDEDETVRQTLERVMREKGMWKEPKTMHTEIGDFSYYDDDDGNGNGNAPTNAANNQSSGDTRDYTVNTESLIGKPSSYFQNNNSDRFSRQKNYIWSAIGNNAIFDNFILDFLYKIWLYNITKQEKINDR